LEIDANSTLSGKHSSNRNLLKIPYLLLIKIIGDSTTTSSSKPKENGKILKMMDLGLL
jgi:hypothetical protein